MKTLADAHTVTQGKLHTVHDIKAYWGSECLAPLILNLVTRCRSVVNFTPPSFYHGKESRYPLNRRQSCPFGEKKNLS
jgi:hypothetical protein